MCVLYMKYRLIQDTSLTRENFHILKSSNRANKQLVVDTLADACQVDRENGIFKLRNILIPTDVFPLSCRLC